MLTSELLSSFESGVSYVRRRVKVYSAGGNQIGFARLGEGDERLKFPGHWIIGHALQDPDWARFSRAEELAEDPTRPVRALGAPERPRFLIYKDAPLSQPFSNH